MKVLEYNVDDIGYGGVFALIKNVIYERPAKCCIDIAAVEKFERQQNITELKSLGCQVFYIGRVGSKVVKQFAIARNLYSLLRQQNYDCVHIHGDVANKLFIAALISRLCRTHKIILHSHASGVDGNNRALKKIFHYTTRWILKYLGTDFVACSGLAAEWMYPNISKNQIRIIRNGININAFRFCESKRNSKRKALGINDNTLVIGHVGRFAYQKNHNFLIKTFEAIYIQQPNSILLLLGEGPLEEGTKALVEKLGLEKNVKFCGTTNDISGYLMAMDIFLLPSFFEGLPIAGVEAQTSGLMCIFSDKITRESQILQTTHFLPICAGSESKWAKECIAYSTKMAVENRDAGFSCAESFGFSIKSTVSCLLQIYSY